MRLSFSSSLASGSFSIFLLYFSSSLFCPSRFLSPNLSLTLSTTPVFCVLLSSACLPCLSLSPLSLSSSHCHSFLIRAHSKLFFRFVPFSLLCSKLFHIPSSFALPVTRSFSLCVSVILLSLSFYFSLYARPHSLSAHALSPYLYLTHSLSARLVSPSFCSHCLRPLFRFFLASSVCFW